MKKEVNLDEVLVEVGEFGWYQVRIYGLILLPIFFSAVYSSQYIFAAAAVDYRCKVPECESNPPTFEINGWGPWAYPEDGGSCDRLLPLNDTCERGSFHPILTQTCNSWVYQNTDSMVYTFDLACEEWRRTLVGSMHSAGLFVALPLTAFISDTFGRRVAVIGTAVAPALVGLIRSFSTSYVMYVTLEFLDSAVGAGVYSSGFILALEMVGLKRRVLGGNIISCTFALGQAFVALVAWAVPEWRTLTRVLYVPSFIFIVYCFFLEESVRWLLSKGNKKEAARIIFKAAEVNKKKLSPETIRQLTEEDEIVQDKPETEPEKKKTDSIVLQVLKSRVIMIRLVVCSFWWITVTFIYYGLSINSVSLAGNSYINFMLTALIEIPGYFMSFVTLDRFGRKSSIMSAFFICGLSLVCLPFIPGHIIWLQTCLNLLGKLCISMAFSSIYIYTSELYPTSLRHTLLAVCSFCGRLGQLVAPQTPLLVAYMDSLPYLVFGAMAATSGMLMLLTPETLNTNLPDTVTQAENISVVPKPNQRRDIIE
ncbi:organic cation transporter protein-like [Aricia agestis]|uniref:organic cation transporter protein-like n=1 Tax=Aricia agestis TaxID=91739 RepID=UPI001C20823F|nr:organic cation transporter protein-like [Aricia agestis]